jgi:hypothetical protein
MSFWDSNGGAPRADTLPIAIGERVPTAWSRVSLGAPAGHSPKRTAADNPRVALDAPDFMQATLRVPPAPKPAIEWITRPLHAKLRETVTHVAQTSVDAPSFIAERRPPPSPARTAP